MMFEVDNQNGYNTFTALVNPHQPGVVKELEGRVIRVSTSTGTSRYCKYSLCNSVGIGSIILPQYLKRQFGEQVDVEFVGNSGEFVACDTVRVQPVHAKCSRVDNITIPSSFIVADGDSIPLMVNHDLVLFSVILPDDKHSIIDKSTVVNIETLCNGFLSTFLESKEYKSFLNTFTDGLGMVKNLDPQLLSFYLDHLQEEYNSVKAITLSDIEKSTKEWMEMCKEADLFVFTHMDCVADDEDWQRVFGKAVLLIGNQKRVIFISDKPIVKSVQSLLEREKVKIISFDFANVSDTVKQTAIKHYNQPLNGIDMHSLLFLSKSNDFEADLKLVQQRVWSTVGQVIDSESVSWSHIIGYKAEIDRLRSSIYDYYDYHDEFIRHSIPPCRGVLLFGPTASGKTLLAKTLAADRRFPVLHISTLSLYSKYFGETEARLRACFQQARSIAPCILIMDNVELIAGRRVNDDQDGTGGLGGRLLTTLLNELDGIDTTDSGVVLVACTTDIESVDPAFLRPGRMDSHIHLPYITDPETISRLIAYYEEYYLVKTSGHLQTHNVTPGDVQLWVKSFLI